MAAAARVPPPAPPVSSPPGWTPPAEDDIFALGGNALAVLYGIATDAQAARIFEVAEARRRRYRMETIGAVLLPPYPAGFFRHPILREPFTYQNGGQWDWWAGRFVLAEFQRGNAAKAFDHLRALAARAVAVGRPVRMGDARRARGGGARATRAARARWGTR